MSVYYSCTVNQAQPSGLSDWPHPLLSWGAAWSPPWPGLWSFLVDLLDFYDSFSVCPLHLQRRLHLFPSGLLIKQHIRLSSLHHELSSFGGSLSTFKAFPRYISLCVYKRSLLLFFLHRQPSNFHLVGQPHCCWLLLAQTIIDAAWKSSV